MRHVPLLIALLPATVLANQARAKHFPFGGSDKTGWLAHDTHDYDGLTTDPDAGVLTVRGDARAYLVEDWTQFEWSKHRYVRFDLRRHTLRFTVELSGVQCDCAACLYLSLMKDPSDATDNYCGIRTPQGGIGNQTCTEIDLMEANTKAFQTTVHTRTGLEPDGTCNELGCTVNWGNESATASGARTADLYGRGGLIDTSHPFNVTATFDAAGAMRVTLEQGSVRLNNFNSSSASNPNANMPRFPTPTGVPPAALKRTADSMAQGMVLVMSLWGGFDKLQNWLNGQCEAPYEPCPWPPDNQTMRLSGLQLLPNPTASAHPCSISSFGGVADNRTDNTVAFRAAAASGCEILTVEPGTWLTGPFNLSSNTVLHVAAGATIAGNRDPSVYPIVVLQPLDEAFRAPHFNNSQYMALVSAYGASNVTVTGGGVIDGQGWDWWRNWTANSSALWAHQRPKLLEFVDCEGLTVSNLTLRNSPFWHSES
jgi:hypothetical protein